MARKRMPEEWVRLSVRLPRHPKIVKAGPMAAWLFVGCVCYAREHLTDGVVPRAAIPGISTIPRPFNEVAKLVAAGLLEEDGEDYRVHDFTTWQETRTEVEARREENRKRVTEWRERQGS